MKGQLAIIGLAARLPGARTATEFMRNLRNGAESISRLDDAELLAAGVPSELVRRSTYVRAAPVLDDYDRFDAAFFDYSPREARIMDPQHRVILETCWSAMEDAGYGAGEGGRRVGVFAGGSGNVTSYLVSEASRSPELLGPTGSIQQIGSDKDFLATRVAFKLNLTGPALTVQTACSTSLVAVHVACQSILAGECDMAIAAAVSVRIPHRVGYLYEDGGILSPDGHCRPFDAKSQGTLFGSGAGAIVIKRLEDAIADGDCIRAVIKGSAIGNDGASKTTFGASSVEGIARVVREALEVAGVEADTIGYIEAHGSGTALGDPVEISALNRAFRKQTERRGFCRIGSVKSNIGHLEHAAGMASLIKTVLMLEHELFVPSINFASPNPRIDFDKTPFVVGTDSVEWKAAGPRRAGVTSLGMGGTNAHIVLEQAPARSRRGEATRPVQVLRLSARSEPALQTLAKEVAAHLLESPEVELADACFTANVGRAEFEHRLLTVGSDRSDIAARLDEFARGESVSEIVTGLVPARSAPLELAFLFTGQGSQYAGMGRTLYDTEPVFRSALDACAAIVDAELKASLLDVIFGNVAGLDETGNTQPALFALEYSLAKLWESWGVTPAIAMGHSLGEYVAACLAGVMSLEDALRLVALRARLMQSLASGGGMLAVSAAEQIVAELGLPLEVAAVNAESEIVLSGKIDEIERSITLLRERGIRCKPLAVSHAFHSALMEPILDTFEKAASAIEFRRPRFPIISNLTGAVASGRDLVTAAYWRDHLRSTVRWSAGVATLYERGLRAFLEVGPAPVLTGLGAGAGLANARWITSLRKGTNDNATILAAVQALSLAGVTIDWRGVQAPAGGRRTSLPTYPFVRDRHWAVSAAVSARPSNAGVLGRRVFSPALRDVVFEGEMSLATAPFLTDIRIAGQPVYPASGYALLAQEAGREALGGEVLAEDLSLLEACTVGDGEARLSQFIVRGDRRGGKMFQMYSRASATSDREPTWQLHAEGRLRLAPARAFGDAFALDRIKQGAEVVEGERYYGRLELMGYEFGSSFARIRRVWINRDEVLGEVHSSSSTESRGLHPGVLESCLQLALAKVGDTLYLPIGMEAVQLPTSLPQTVFGYVKISEKAESASAIIANIKLLDAAGQVLGKIDGYCLKRVARASVGVPSYRDVVEWFYGLVWAPARIPAAPRPARQGTWVVVTDDVTSVDTIRSEIEGIGESCVVVSATQAQRTQGDGISIDPFRPEDCLRLLRDVAVDAVPLRAVVVAFEGGAQPLANAAYATVLHLVQAMAETERRIEGPRLVVVTRGGQTQVGDAATNPAHTALGGLAAVIAQEHPELRCVAVDIDTRSERSVVSEALCAERDVFVAYRNNVRSVARLVRNAASKARLRVPAGEWRLGVTTPGVLENVAVHATEFSSPTDFEVVIRVSATGIGTSDVVGALADGLATGRVFGRECSGVIVACGAAVTGLSVGDEVMAIAPASLATLVTVDANLVVRRPASLPVEAAAAVPIPFVTAIACLDWFAKALPDETVLIDVLPDGIDLALIQVAKAAGMKVIAVRASRDHALARQFGASEVLAPGPDLWERVRASTQGAGVDVFVSGRRVESPEADILRRGSCYVHVGAAEPAVFDELRKAGVSCYLCNPDKLPYAVSKDVGKALERIAEAFDRGELKAISHKSFAVADALTALRVVADGTTASRTVLAARASMLKTVPPGPLTPLDPDAWYVVTGAFGALGRRVVQWLTSSGARKLALLGRTVDDQFAAGLRRAGIDVYAEPTDVGQREMLARAFESLGGRGRVRGVIHAAGVLDDGMLVRYSWERFANVLAAKAHGAWHLHELTAYEPLDFFVLFSSATSLLGTPGQASYAAANAFLDGLAHRRREMGLPAMSINWGPWAGPGIASKTSAASGFATGAAGAIAPELGIEALGRLVQQPMTRVGILPFRWASLVQQWPALRGLTILSRLLSEHADPRRRASDRRSIVEQVSAASLDRRKPLLLDFVEESVGRALGLSAKQRIDRHRGFMELGLDSMLSVQLRNELQEAVGRPLPYALTFNYPNVETLATFLLVTLFGDVEVPTAEVGLITTPPSSATEERSPPSQEELHVWLEEELRTAERMRTIAPSSPPRKK